MILMNDSISKLNIHNQALLRLVSNNLFHTDYKIELDSDGIKEVWLEAYLQAVGLIAFAKADIECIESPELNFIKEGLSDRLVANTRIGFEHVRINSLMTQAGIPYTIIKGLASSMYYSDPLLRATGDIDFLVDPADIERADKLLLDNGFEIKKDTHDCHRVYQKNGFRYEMHFEPSGIPDGEAGELIRSYLCDTVKCAKETATELGNIFVPSVFHHGLIILIHMCGHLTGEGIGLRHLCDWAVFVNSLSDEEFCEMFEEKLNKTGLWRFACIATRLCTEYLGCPAKKWAGQVEKTLTEAIISDILKGGNFGQKISDRSHERLLLSSKGKKASMISQFFSSANSIVYSHWKICRKIKILLPLGWIFFGGRYILRSISGKRPKIRPKNIAQEATERRNIYSQLRLFESE